MFLEASKLTGQVPDANAPSGSVIQISHTTYTGTTSTTSTTPVDVSGFSASITPISVNSRILISVSVVFGFVVDAYPYVLLRRNGTSIGTGVTAYGSNRINTFMSGSATNIGTMMWRVHQFSRNHLDSPNTTSALTYQIAFASPYAGYAGFINRQANADTIDGVYVQYPASSITLMEIAL
jgi:hypothetical protein